MIQLDNTIKGKEMLTPEQIAAHDDQIKQLPTIQKLEQSDQEIIKDLEGLQNGQMILDKKVEVGFEKGRKRMDGIEGEMRELKDEMKGLKNLFIDFMTVSQSNFVELKSEIQNGKIQELREELKTKRNEEDKKSAFRSGLTIGLTVLGVSSIIAAFGFLLSKALWP